MLKFLSYVIYLLYFFNLTWAMSTPLISWNSIIKILILQFILEAKRNVYSSLGSVNLERFKLHKLSYTLIITINFILNEIL